MDEQLKSVHQSMIRIGLGALAHANWHAHYVSRENACWAELSVLQAAHAAELLIKARIAQEHPLLIFEKIPRVRNNRGDPLTYRNLVNEGRTLQFPDLPDRLWASTGIEVPDVDAYFAFGRLRNAVQHFSPPPEQNLSQKTLEFIFSAIDPFINSCWGLYAIDYNEDHEPYEYFVPGIISREILFLVSPDSVRNDDHMHIHWPDNDPYVNEMKRRIEKAKGK